MWTLEIFLWHGKQICCSVYIPVVPISILNHDMNFSSLWSIFHASWCSLSQHSAAFVFLLKFKHATDCSSSLLGIQMQWTESSSKRSKEQGKRLNSWTSRITNGAQPIVTECRRALTITIWSKTLLMADFAQKASLLKAKWAPLRIALHKSTRFFLQHWCPSLKSTLSWKADCVTGI